MTKPNLSDICKKDEVKKLYTNEKENSNETDDTNYQSD